MNGLIEVDDIFSPLSKEYCEYFYILSVIGFGFFWFFLIGGIVYGIKKNLGASYYFQVCFLCANYIVLYFQNRLLHSMCIK